MEAKTRKSAHRALALVLALMLCLTLLIGSAPSSGTAGSGDEATWTKVTSADQFTTGQYYMVTDTGYAPGVLDGTWVTAVEAANAATEAVWTLTVSGDSVTLTDANDVSIAPKGGNNNGIKQGDYDWVWSFNNGKFTFSGRGNDTVVLASNTTKTNGENRFRAYKTTTVSSNPEQYPSEFTLYQLTDGGSVTPGTVAAPQASPQSGAVASGTEITLTCATTGASIYYTLDGTNPTTSSTLYYDNNKPTITASCTLKAVAIKDGVSSAVQTVEYTIKAESEAPIAAGDKVVIYAPAYNKALSSEKTGFYNVGTDITVDGDGTVTGFTAADVWTVVDNGDGTFGTYLDAENLFDKIDSLMEDENAIERIGIKTGEDWSEIGDYDASAHRPLAGYSALPELINGYLRSNGGLGGMSAEVLAAAYYDDGTEEGALQLTISADIRALINDRLTSGESEPDEVLMHFLPQFVPEKLYLNVTYSLGGEGEIGLDINNADENYGEGQSEADLNAIFEFMKVFGVELTFQNAEGETVPINDVSQMKEMLGDMFDSVFVEVGQQLGGDIVMTETGVLFPNIFEVIAANEQLDWSEDLGMSFEDYQRYYEIGDEDLYVILRQMYGYSYTDSNTSEDISAVRSELARKYYLDLESDDSAGLFDEIRELSTSFTSKLRMQTSGSLPGMADDTAATSELLPQIYASDIGMLIQASGSISMADISMIKNVRVLYTTVTSGADGDVMEMILVGDVDTDNITDPDTQQPVENAQKYKTLFPDQMFFSVIVYENGGNEGYDTAYTINDISDSLLTKTMFFIGRFSGDSSVSEEKIGEQINSGVNNAMNDLSVNGAVEIDIAGQPDGSGCITLGTVFSVATGSIWRDENTQEIDEANRPSDDEFRGTIKALWAGMEGYTYSNGEAAANAGYTQETARFLIDGQNVSTRISDAFIASQIGTAEKLEDIASSVGIDPASAAEALALYQTYILPSTSESGEAAEISRYNDISGYFADTELLESGEGNLVITLAAKSEFFNTSSEGAVKDNTLLPETIYISAGISLTETGLDNVRMVFNRMTAEQTAILQKIMEYADFDTSAFGDRDGALSSSIASTVLVSQDITVGIDQVYPVRVTVGDLFGQDGETAFNSAVTDTDDYIYEDYNGAKIGLGHIGYIKSISDLIAEAGQ